MARSLVRELPPLAEELMEKFWPGPLTIIFKAAEAIPKTITAGTGKVGLRVSSSLVAGKLVTLANSPITATSANPTGLDPARTADQVAGYFGDGIDVIIDGGLLRERTPSTIVDITENKVIMLREGTVRREDLKENL
jgi:L-threonylcarbamoyladenylate synthase